MSAQRFARGWLWAALIFFLLMIGIGAIPGQAQVLSGRVGDKFLHMLAYAFLTGLIFRSAPGRTFPKGLIAFSLTSLLGLLDETLQLLLPYRNASFADWCFDMAASLLVVLALILAARKQSLYRRGACTESE